MAAQRGSSGNGKTKKSTATRKTSAAKKTTGRTGKTSQTKSKTTGNGRKSRSAEETGSSAVRSEISILVALALTLFGTLSTFGLCGSVGAVIRNILFGVFGILACAVPLLFFLAVMFFVSNLGNGKAMGKLVAGLLIVPDLCGLIQMVVSPYEKGEALKEIYAAGTGGGWLGGAVKQGLCGVFDVVGAYLILVLILLICLVVITEKSITRWLRSGGERFLGRARDDYDYRVEQNEEKRARDEEKREEQRIQREERRRQTEERRRREEERREERRRQAEERLAAEAAEDGAETEKEARGRRTDHKVRGVEITDNTVIPDAAEEEARTDSRRREDAPEVWEEGRTENERNLLPDGAPAADGSVGTAVRPAEDLEAYEEELLTPPEDEAEDVTVEWWNPYETEEPISGDVMDRLEQELRHAEEDTAEAPGPDREQPMYLDGEPVQTADGAPDSAETAEEPLPEDEETGLRPEDDTAEAYGEPDALSEGVRRLDFMQERVSRRMEEFETVKPDTAAGEKAAPLSKPAPPVRKYVKPPTSLLNAGGRSEHDSDSELNRVADKLQDTLKRFGVNVTITDVSRGPSVTRYELLPEAGTRVNRITSLSDDIKLALAATDIRIEAPIPGKSAIGIEVPNKKRETVYLKELVESGELKGHGSKIAFAAGKDIAGKVIVADIAKMPHMLIAGTTGSGKSVFTNSIIMTILFRATPDEVKLIIIDPKVVEFGIYNGIPHLMTPVVTDPRKAAEALKWATAEMSRRYQTFANENVRDLKGYNKKIEREHLTDKNGEPLQKLPQIVIIIDELADLMMVAAKDVEETICRLAQLARAAGIHLIIATQRPSVDVVTGLIKANIPSRVALLVSSGVDSRTIIDMNGAEKLLGNGDMLFAPSGYAKPVRLQGAFVSDEEVRSVVDFLKKQVPEGGASDAALFDEVEADQPEEEGADRNERDELFADAGRFLIEKKRASVSLLQRKFRIGFNRAARIIDQLEEAGVVGEELGTKPRNLLMTQEEFEEFLKS